MSVAGVHAKLHTIAWVIVIGFVTWVVTMLGALIVGNAA
jgi:hypothetical protein